MTPIMNSHTNFVVVSLIVIPMPICLVFHFEQQVLYYQTSSVITLKYITPSQDKTVSGTDRKWHANFSSTSGTDGASGWLSIQDDNVPPFNVSVFVYSAYYRDDVSSVDVISQIQSDLCDAELKVNCTMSSGSDLQRPYTTMASATCARAKRFTAAYANAVVHCPVLSDIGFRPEVVTLTLLTANTGHGGEPTSSIGRALPVRYERTIEKTPPPQTFILCVSGLLHNITDVTHIVQFMELHRLLGVHKVVVYTSPSTNPASQWHVWRALELYRLQGFIDIYPWDLVDKLGWRAVMYGGQVALINECFQRYRSAAEYLAVYDIDEVLIPSGHLLTWQEMFGKLKAPPDAARFEFTAATFVRDRQQRLGRLLPTSRRPHGRWSYFNMTTRWTTRFNHKSVYRPRKMRARLIKVHKTAADSADSGQTVRVKRKMGRIHHYRNLDAIMRIASVVLKRNITQPARYVTQDTSISKYESQLTSATQSRIKTL